jgi:hypothetical protein
MRRGEFNPSDQVVSVGTYHLQMHREGRGSPVVVIAAQPPIHFR